MTQAQNLDDRVPVVVEFATDTVRGSQLNITVAAKRLETQEFMIARANDGQANSGCPIQRKTPSSFPLGVLLESN
jgi:hypothetical protein